jgi:acetyl esterase/lipase
MAANRECEAKAFYKTTFYKKFHDNYDAVVTPQETGGVHTEVFTPKDGIAPKNNDRVLINVHGGHFKMGARTISHLESIPIASVGKIKVISIDYRMAPEYAFPAASEDVAAVYRELLKTYNPKNIGLYGCSAGSLLTAESIAWFQKEGLPLPAAVGMFGGAASYYQEGDSARLSSAMGGFPLEPPQVHPYFKGTDAKDPLAFPIYSRQIMSKFPPSLLIATIRDIGESAVVYTHSQLVKLGVEADLHVWEGLDHCFFGGTDLPESRDVYDVIVKFFDRHLGQPEKAQSVAPGPTLEGSLAAEIGPFVKADAASPLLDQAQFTGSSSIVNLQGLAMDMTPLPVINRGFGDSHIEYVNRRFDQIVAPPPPRAVLFNAGENDIAAGKPVRRN